MAQIPFTILAIIRMNLIIINKIQFNKIYCKINNRSLKDIIILNLTTNNLAIRIIIIMHKIKISLTIITLFKCKINFPTNKIIIIRIILIPICKTQLNSKIHKIFKEIKCLKWILRMSLIICKIQFNRLYNKIHKMPFKDLYSLIRLYLNLAFTTLIILKVKISQIKTLIIIPRKYKINIRILFL